MSEHPNSSTAVLDDDGVRSPEDAFRRATFNWALSTKKMVDIAQLLGKNTRVTRAALADVEYARDLLDGLYLPLAKAGNDMITVPDVQQCVASLATRVQEQVNRIMEAPPIITGQVHRLVEPQVYRGVDLSAPVYSSGGKMLWASVDCPKCPSKASQRCQRDDGAFVEKPHKERKTLAEQGQNA